MAVLTEYALRSELKDANIKEFIVEKNTIITPSARQYLHDKNIKLVFKEDRVSEENNQNIQHREEKQFLPKYEGDRKSVVRGRSEVLGGRGIIKKKKREHVHR